MAKTFSQALAKSKNITSGYGGYCLQFVRICFGVGPKYASAISAWNNAKYKHRTSTTRNIPVGAPIFFSGSRYGHVAIYMGNGYMRTTSASTGRIHTHKVSSWVAIGYRLLGWTEDLNGVRVYTPAKKKKKKKANSGLKVDGIMGPNTIKKWQRIMGTPVDGVISPGNSTLVRAVQRHLNKKGYKLAVDGSGIYSNVKGKTDKSKTQAALQRYLGTPADGYFSKPSAAVVALQKRLNKGKF
jgi:peptidoglycan hydrolase-like protein with peptidoglycan-binding domain